MKKKKHSALPLTATPSEYRLQLSAKQTGVFLFSILILALIAYSNSFSNQFNLRDDQVYVTENPLLGDLSWQGIQRIITTLYYNGHLPVTIFSLAIDFHFWQLQPFGYHVTSFSLHLFNILLVFYFVKVLSSKKELALFCAFIFALHPMAAQSVVWISERKNLLYATFFLLSLIAYVKYLKKDSLYFFGFSLLFFMLSVMSKWAAYTLPVNILLLNIFFKRKWNKKMLVELLFFFIIPFISYYFHIQSGVEIEQRYSLIDRFFFGSYTFLFYLYKAVLPIQLSTLYPYPNKVVGALPWLFYVSMPVAILVVGALLFYLKNNFWDKKNIWFGFLFFLINIGMVLQVIMFIGGHELAADRYGYVPFIGIFILLGELFFIVLRKIKYAPHLLKVCIVISSVFMISATRSRNEAWFNTATIYEDALKKNPDIAIAYLYRGEYYWKINELHKAVDDFTTCINKFPKNKFCLLDRGELYLENNNYDIAKADFLRVLEIDSENIYAHDFLGKIAVIEGAYQEAVAYYSVALKSDSTNAMTLNNMGYSLYSLKQYEQADIYFDRALAIDTNMRLAFLNKGWSFIEQEKYDEALEVFNRAISNNDGDPMFYNNRGLTLFHLKQYDAALNDFNRSAALNPDLSYPFYNSALIYFELNQHITACENLQKAINNKHEDAQKLFDEKCGNIFPYAEKEVE